MYKSIKMRGSSLKKEIAEKTGIERKRAWMMAVDGASPEMIERQQIRYLTKNEIKKIKEKVEEGISLEDYLSDVPAFSY